MLSKRKSALVKKGASLAFTTTDIPGHETLSPIAKFKRAASQAKSIRTARSLSAVIVDHPETPGEYLVLAGPKEGVSRVLSAQIYRQAVSPRTS
jgi:hypothetical protein